MSEEMVSEMAQVLDILVKAKKDVELVFSQDGWDLAYFDVDISLMVMVGDKKVVVQESWEAIS